MSESCIFCKIIKGEIPGKKIYENEWVLCVEDIKPSAAIHYLFLPKKHFKSLVELELEKNSANGKLYLEKIFTAISHVAHEKGFAGFGYKTVINTGEQGGQTVFHLHVHVLSGNKIKNTLGHV